MSFPPLFVGAAATPPIARHALGRKAADALPFGGLLRGMVSAGVGFDAICLFLRLARSTLDQALVHLNLPTPHDRPPRAPGPRGWSAENTTRLIAWRLDGVHPADIGARLGRSVGGVRARCRRLGVPTPPRTRLRRQAPDTIADPPADAFSRGLVPATAAQPPSATNLGLRHVQAQFRASPLASHSPPSRTMSLPFRAETPCQADAVGTPTSPAVVTAATVPLSPLSVVTPAATPDGGDLAWVQRHRRWRKCREVIEALAAAYFGGQHHRKIAERAGVSVARLQSFWHRVELPRDRHRTRFSEQANDGLGRQRLAESGYRLTECAVSGNLFFRHARDVGVRMCRKVRFAQGKLDDWDRYRSQEVSLT